MCLSALGRTPEPVLGAKTQQAMLTPYLALRTSRRPRSTRPTLCSELDVAQGLKLPARDETRPGIAHPCRTWLLDPRPRACLRQPITRRPARPRTLLSQRDLQAPASPQMSSIVVAAGERVETMVEDSRARGAHTPGTSILIRRWDIWKTTVSPHVGGAQHGTSPLTLVQDQD